MSSSPTPPITVADWLRLSREQQEQQREHLLDTLLQRQPKLDDEPAGT